MEFVMGVIRVRVTRPATLTVLIGPIIVKTVQVTEGSGPVEIALGDNQFTTIHLQGLDSLNQAGKFTSPPKWTVEDESIVKLTVTDDGLNARVEAQDTLKLGTTNVTVTDVDDPNVPAIVFPITIGGEQITHFGATIDPPTEKTPPAA